VLRFGLRTLKLAASCQEFGFCRWRVSESYHIWLLTLVIGQPEREVKMFGKAITVIFALTFAAMFLMYVNMAEAQIVTDGLVSYWTFDEADIDGDIVKDLIGTNDGDIFDPVEIVEGKVNQAMLFAGGRIEVPDSDTTKPEQFSFQFWVYSNLEFGATTRFELIDNTGQLVIRNEERAEFGSNLAFHSVDGAWYGINPPDVPSAEEWHNVAVTHDGSVGIVYLDGNPGDPLEAGFTYSGAELGISIGAHKWAMANFFDGMLDEILFYGKALTEAEVMTNYSATGLAVAYTSNKLPVCWGEMKASR